jgi:hypothetical protein
MRYGISTISLWPYSLGPGGMARSIDMAREAGFFGIQAVAMKGWGDVKVSNLSRFVLSYELPWSDGSLINEIKKIKRPKDILNVPINVAFFGKLGSQNYPTAIHSEHDFVSVDQWATAVEIHPDLCLDTAPYLNYAYDGGKLCWDTYHVRRDHRERPDVSISWVRLLYMLPEQSITLVHVHLTDDINGFMENRGPTVFMLRDLQQQRNKLADDVFVILEVKPQLLASKDKVIQRFEKMLEVIKLNLHDED